MPAVRLLTGDRAGDVVQVTAWGAQAGLAAGFMELVTAEKPETPERAARAGVETRRRPARPRKSAE